MASERVNRANESIRTGNATQRASQQLSAAFYAELRVAARYLETSHGYKARDKKADDARIAPDKHV